MSTSNEAEKIDTGKFEEAEQNVEPVASYGWGIRHVQVAVMAAAAFVAYSLRVNLSVAIVAMIKYENQTTPDLAPRYNWGEDIQGYLLSSFFWGYFVLQVPAGIITTKFGGHRFLCFSILGSSLLTILLPQCTYYGGWFAVCLNRMIQGVFQGFVFPSIFTLLGKWAPPHERSGFSGLSLGAQLLGTVATTSLSGYLCSAYGWPSVFYCFGSAGVSVAIVMLFMGADSPGDHKMISDAEKLYIQKSLGGETVQMAVPWKNVLTNIPFWSALLTMACQAMVFLMLLTKIPTYLQTVLHFRIEDNGVLTAIPYLFSYMLTFVYSWACNFVVERNLLSLTATRKVLNSIAHFGSAICILLMAHTTDRVVSVILLTVLMGTQGASFTGVQANFVDLAPNFSGAIFSVGNFSSACLGLTGPIIVGFIVTEVGSIVQWRIVFYICAAVFTLSNIIYIMFGTAETQWWNWPDQSPDGKDPERRKSARSPSWIEIRKGSIVLP